MHRACGGIFTECGGIPTVFGGIFVLLASHSHWPLVARFISAVLLAISEDYFCFLRFFSFLDPPLSREHGLFLSFFLRSAFPNSKAHGNTNQGPRIRQGSRFLLRQCATCEFRPLHSAKKKFVITLPHVRKLTSGRSSQVQL